jgi:hypothetical protein
MPDGDFFWNACRTYTAFSNRTVYTSIRVSVVRLDDLQDARTKPLPRLRRRRGTAELRDTESVPHVFLDRRRKAQEIALGGPDPVQRLLVGSRDTSHVTLSQFWYNHASCMSVDPRLDVLPTFQITTITPGTETTLVGGIFSRPESVAVGNRGWLFVSETESSIADIITLGGGAAGLDIPNWSMTRHIQEAAVLPWLDARWQARDLAFLLDDTKEWRRVQYRPTDAVVFAKPTMRCGQCGWTGSAGADMSTCPKCSGTLSEQVIFGNQEAAFRSTLTRASLRLGPDSGTMITA